MSQEPSFSDGREVEVFRRHSPEVLPGVHAALMTSALLPEAPRYLVYAPIYDAFRGPFGLRSRPASHAVAVTGTRLLISEDPHEEGSGPLILSLPLERVLVVGTGCALLQGWLSIHYARAAERGPAQTTLFYCSTGSLHFSGLVRQCRSILGEKSGPRRGAAAVSWQEVWPEIPAALAAEMKSLLVEGESPLVAVPAFTRMSGAAIRDRKGHRMGTGPAAAIATTHGLLLAEEETPPRSEVMTFGVHARALPPGAIREVRLDPAGGGGTGEEVLRVLAGFGPGELQVELSVPESSRARAERLCEIYS